MILPPLVCEDCLAAHPQLRGAAVAALRPPGQARCVMCGWPVVLAGDMHVRANGPSGGQDGADRP